MIFNASKPNQDFMDLQAMYLGNVDFWMLHNAWYLYF